MEQSGCRPRHLRFGGFEADLHAGELTRRGKRVWLQEQPFRLLAILLEMPGELVTREELRERLWPQTTVDFDHGLNKAISNIRNLLRAFAENPRFVETVAGRGYRFLADVNVIRDARVEVAETVLAVPGGPEPPGLTEIGAPTVWRSRAHAWSLYGVGFALFLAIAVVLSWIFYPWGRSSPAIRSLAVLPLENLSGDASQDYFADGMTEELITDLGQISTLRVISRTSAMTYRKTQKPLADIARELNVEAIVEGSVLRSGDHVRITAQLIEAPADRHLWAESFEGDVRETLALQSSVARTIARQIRATLDRKEQAALDKSEAVNAEAYEAYLKGRYFWNKRTGDGLRRAIAFFSEAIEADPSYAPAYSGLADAYALAGDWEYEVLSPQDAFRQARAAAAKALELDDSLGEAHTSLAFALDLYSWDWQAAEKEYEQAIKLSPGYSTLHLWYGWHLMVIGRTSEGIVELRKAQNLDPLSLIVGADLADALSIVRLYDDSERQSRRTLELDSNFAVGHYELGQTLVQKQRAEEAIAEFQKAIAISGHSGAFDSNLAYAYAVVGRKDQAMSIAAALAASDQNHSADANIALIYVGLKDNDQAMVWLEKAFAARFNPSILLRPAWDPLRSDARFKDLRRRIGLPQ